MKENTINYENEALRLKSLVTLIAMVDTENTSTTIYELVEVAKMATEIAETLYCAFANGEVKKCS